MQPLSKRLRTGTWGTVPGDLHGVELRGCDDAGCTAGVSVPWVQYRFNDTGDISGYCVYVAFTRLALSDVSQLLATVVPDPLISRIPSLNSSVPRACDDYWAMVEAAVRATFLRDSRPPINSSSDPVSDSIPVIDPNSRAAGF